MWVIFKSKEIADEVVCTPDLEGGIGPVMLGDPVTAEDGRVAYNHPWSEVSEGWLTGYGGTVAEELPKDFVVKNAEV